MGKVKIIGYAKKEFFTNGIEYRNFSPDLVGNQFANTEGTSVFTSANFNITTNLDGKVSKTFITKEFTNLLTLSDLNIDVTTNNIINLSNSKIKLNLDYSDLSTYATFGSLREYIRVSLENIIINWPASLYVVSVDPTDPILTGDTVSDYSYNLVTKQSTFNVSTERIINSFDINFLTGGTIIDTFNETNSLRNLTVNYGSYVISNTYGDFVITNLIGASADTNSYISVTVDGNPFPSYGSEVIDYHIKPNETKKEQFFISLNEFENTLLNRFATPIYTSKFKVYRESESGVPLEMYKSLTWPVSDGYNIDFNTQQYLSFVEELISISDDSDGLKSNLMVRFLVSTSISEFDTIPDISGSYEATNGEKMTNTLKIYGREFDELKNYSDAISFANIVTYNKKNNTPDLVLKNLGRILGWELTTSLTNNDVSDNFLKVNPTIFGGHSRGLTDAEAEVELWRRIILNTPWIWKSKGTRKAIEFLFKFLGTPDDLVTFNEYVYVADNPVNIELIKEMMLYFNDTDDITSLNVDSSGYPKILVNNSLMYFQKAGLWYRTTGGNNPDIDILSGNNPHVGPYDGGQAYMNQFTSCLVPNFVGGLFEENDVTGNANLFTNYNNGTFDECCDSDILVKLDTNKDFNSILTTNINKFLSFYAVTESGCTITNSWSIIASLTGNTFYENTFFSGSSAPTELDYVSELYNLTGTTELSGSTVIYNSENSEFIIINSDEDCENPLLDTYIKIEVCLDSSFDCVDEGTSGLTSFNASTLTHNACTPIALSLTRTLYHNGVNLLPDVGDTIFTDSLGVNKLITSPDAHILMDGNFGEITNWIETDGSGLRVAIICPTITCSVVIGKAIQTVSGVAYDKFYLNGLTELNYISITYQLVNIQLSQGSTANAIFLDDLGETITLTNTSPTVNRVKIVNANTQFDYAGFINPRGSFNPATEGYSVKITINSLDKDCLAGTTNSITFNYGINNNSQ